MESLQERITNMFVKKVQLKASFLLYGIVWHDQDLSVTQKQKTPTWDPDTNHDPNLVRCIRLCAILNEKSQAIGLTGRSGTNKRRPSVLNSAKIISSATKPDAKH